MATETEVTPAYVTALGLIGIDNSTAIDNLTRSLDDKVELVRSNITEALGWIDTGDPATIEVSIDLLEDDSAHLVCSREGARPGRC